MSETSKGGSFHVSLRSQGRFANMSSDSRFQLHPENHDNCMFIRSKMDKTDTFSLWQLFEKLVKKSDALPEQSDICFILLFA